MRPARPRELYAAGVIERHGHHVLIVTGYVAPPSVGEGTTPAREGPERWWMFPRGPAHQDESPEAAMRRIARSDLGVQVEVFVGQPPVVQRIDGREVEVRYLFCGLVNGEPRPGVYADVRWVPRGQLREYDFDAASAQVVEWLLKE